MRRVVVPLAIAAAACRRDAPPAHHEPAPVPVAATPDASAVDVADMTTTASPAWQPGPKVVADPVAAAVDGKALRARHRARIHADTSPVTVLAGGTAAELGARLCEAVVPARPPGTPVLLKPNLGGFDWFKDPRTHGGDNGVAGRITDPEFVRGVIRCLKARGHTAITIADGFTGKAADWDRLARVSGYAKLAADEGVALVALDDDGVFDVQGDTPGKPLAITGLEHTGVPTLLVPKLLADHLDHGLYLSLPKIKAHRFAVFSLGIKAMQGGIMYADAAPAFRQKWRSHKELDKALAAIKRGDPKARAMYVAALERFAERMTDVLELEAPDAVLAEGAPAMGGDGFQRLVPAPGGNVAIGGTNPILVDRVAAEYLGLWDSAELARELGGHETSPLLEVAAKRFDVALAHPALTGDGAALLAERRPGYLVAMAGFVIGDAGPPAGLHAPRLAGAPPPIDGVVDGAWAAATPIEFATDWAGRPTAVPTRVRMLWSPDALYLLWELDAAGLGFTDRSRAIDTERTDLYVEDSVEVFVAPDPANRLRYAEIELGPYGHFFDLMIDRSGARTTSDPAWSAGLSIGTTRDEATHHAVIEVAVTAPAVVAGLVAGAKLPIGLYRTEGQGKRTYLAAFPTRTPKPNFHVPDAFGTVTLDP